MKDIREAIETYNLRQSGFNCIGSGLEREHWLNEEEGIILQIDLVNDKFYTFNKCNSGVFEETHQ